MTTLIYCPILKRPAQIKVLREGWVCECGYISKHKRPSTKKAREEHAKFRQR